LAGYAALIEAHKFPYFCCTLLFSHTSGAILLTGGKSLSLKVFFKQEFSKLKS